MNCRFCKSKLEHVVVDLGRMPASNAYIAKTDIEKSEIFYPLRVLVCETCWLVQTEDFADADELFSQTYAYFSSVSKSWLAHAERYCEMICNKLDLDSQSHVLELAANDGYLLKNFIAKNIPCLGVEPTKSTASAARELGIPVLEEFFGENLANKLLDLGKKSDLVIGNNVFAHVPDINDFILGVKKILKVDGTITFEFPHLLNLVNLNQFDTIYHEHFSYFSLKVVSDIFRSVGLKVYDVEELPTHGGSLRIYGCHVEDQRDLTENVLDVVKKENVYGLRSLDTYRMFHRVVEKIRNDLLNFLLKNKSAGKKIAGYGAAAKGNTLLNYCGIDSQLITYICDAAPSKQYKYMPGSRIPILPPEKIKQDKPDIIVILPWNLHVEITTELDFITEWGGEFVIAIPEVRRLA